MVKNHQWTYQSSSLCMVRFSFWPGHRFGTALWKFVCHEVASFDLSWNPRVWTSDLLEFPWVFPAGGGFPAMFSLRLTTWHIEIPGSDSNDMHWPVDYMTGVWIFDGKSSRQKMPAAHGTTGSWGNMFGAQSVHDLSRSIRVEITWKSCGCDGASANFFGHGAWTNDNMITISWTEMETHSKKRRQVEATDWLWSRLKSWVLGFPQDFQVGIPGWKLMGYGWTTGFTIQIYNPKHTNPTWLENFGSRTDWINKIQINKGQFNPKSSPVDLLDRNIGSIYIH